jgi:hypothetical protein
MGKQDRIFALEIELCVVWHYHACLSILPGTKYKYYEESIKERDFKIEIIPVTRWLLSGFHLKFLPLGWILSSSFLCASLCNFVAKISD